MYSSSHLGRETCRSDPTCLASWAAGEDGVAAAHPKAIPEGARVAAGWEGGRAQECIAVCFQAATAAKRPSALLATKPAPQCSSLTSRWAGQQLPWWGELGTPTAGSTQQLQHVGRGLELLRVQQSCTHLHHIRGCICGAALRKHKTRSNIRPRYAAVLRFDVKVRIKNHFCPARRSDGLARFCARLHHVSPRIDRVRWWVPH